MKLIIQIPCYNEEGTLAIALNELPREVEGFDKVEWLIINDGSQDKTVEVAKANGVDHVVNFKKNRGLAKGFMAGIQRSLELGADVIVNTDADNQYCAADIPKLTAPVVSGEADLVIGARPISQIEHFSPIKKFLQKLGSWVVRVVSSTNVPDAPSGFRAISKEAAMQFNVFNDYTYTIETIIQAGQANMSIATVPIRVNEDLRPSRLFKSIPSYIKKSVFTMIRIFIIYRPFYVFMMMGMTTASFGLLIFLRFMVFYMIGDGQGHVQSLILGSTLFLIGFQILSLAFIADLSATNRKLLENIKTLSLRNFILRKNEN